MSAMMTLAFNHQAWALGQVRAGRFHVRRIVWGLALANAEVRESEQIRRATIMVEPTYKRRRKDPL